MNTARLATLLLVPLLAACAGDGPTAPDRASSPAAQLTLEDNGATSFSRERSFPVHFRAPVPCLGGPALVSGMVHVRERVVERPDGARHVTQLMDVSDVTITRGDRIWTSNPNASEIFVQNFAPNGLPQQFQHVGVVVYRGGEGEPELRLMHQIHLVRAPDGSLQMSTNVFGISCIGR